MKTTRATGARWELLLTAAAETDFRETLRWTAEQFGEAQAGVYAETLSAAIQALVDGPTIVGVKPRDDIAKGIYALHVARDGRRGRHFVMFRVPSPDRSRLEILRLLHDAMDLPRHLPGAQLKP